MEEAIRQWLARQPKRHRVASQAHPGSGLNPFPSRRIPIVNIREAVPGDAEAIARVHVASWRTTYAGIVAQSYLDGLNVADGARSWERRLLFERVGTTLVAEDEAGIFGFASGGAPLHPVDGYQGELYAIYLLQSHQQRGVGAELMREVACSLRRDAILSMVVWALAENKACGFYRHMGGVRIAEKPIEIGGKALPEIAFGWPDISALCPAKR